MHSGIGQAAEPFGAALQLSGDQIIDMVCSEVAEALGRSCDLRGTDAYRSFACRVVIDLQLTDLDVTNVVQEIAIGGKIKPEHAVERVEVDVPSRRGYVSRVRAGK